MGLTIIATKLEAVFTNDLSKMAQQRRKQRTNASSENLNVKAGRTGVTSRPPRSLVVRMGAGDVGPSVSQLTRDFRAVVEPDTASRLKERKSNKLKDYTAMAGPLGVTHLFLFSRSKSGNVHLRIALTPRGPTMTFKVENYALRKDIAKAQKHPRAGGSEYKTAPLLVMNNFASQDKESTDSSPINKQLESLTTTVFQSIFPPISPQTTPLSTIKRILLLNREKVDNGAYVITLRHYAITTRRTGISKRVRRFDSTEQRTKEKKSGAVPNLGKLDDMADYLLDPAAGGYTSASETELDTDNEIEVMETATKRVLSKKEMEKLRNGEKRPIGAKPTVEKRAVKLVELGPRMRLHLVKVEEGICEGRVMWNEFVTKTKDEEKELDDKWEDRRKEKEARRAVQKANVERKRQLRKNTKGNAGQTAKDGEGGIESDEEQDWDSDEIEDMLERGAEDDDIDGAQEMEDVSTDEEDAEMAD